MERTQVVAVGYDHCARVWDGQYVITPGEDSTSCLWNSGAGNKLRSFRGHPAGEWAIIVSSIKKRLFSGLEDRSVGP